MEIKVQKLVLTGYCRDELHTADYSSPNGLTIEQFEDIVDGFQKAFTPPYSIELKATEE